MLYSEPAFSGISKQLSVTSSSQAHLLHSKHLTFKCQSCAFSAALDKGVHCLVLPHLPLRPFHILSHNYWEITHLQWKVSADPWTAWQAGQETDSYSWKLLWNHRWIVLSFLRPSAHNAELDQWHVSPDHSVREEKVTPAVHGFILMCVLYQSSLNHECRKGAALSLLYVCSECVLIKMFSLCREKNQNCGTNKIFEHDVKKLHMTNLVLNRTNI